MALWLLKEDAGALLRRLAIICLEDALLHPGLPLVVWLMAAHSKASRPAAQSRLAIQALPATEGPPGLLQPPIVAGDNCKGQLHRVKMMCGILLQVSLPLVACSSLAQLSGLAAAPVYHVTCSHLCRAISWGACMPRPCSTLWHSWQLCLSGTGCHPTRCQTRRQTRCAPACMFLCSYMQPLRSRPIRPLRNLLPIPYEHTMAPGLL